MLRVDGRVCNLNLIDKGRHVCPDEFDSVHELGVRELGIIHLKGEARNPAQCRTMTQDFGGDILGIAHHQRACRTVLGVEVTTCDRWPAALFADAGECFG